MHANIVTVTWTLKANSMEMEIIMNASCILTLEDGKSAKIDFFVITDPTAERPYGIGVKMLTDNGCEENYARHRFFTYEEAVKTASFLCAHQVTPCALCDVI